jgi:hypothetical protein
MNTNIAGRFDPPVLASRLGRASKRNLKYLVLLGLTMAAACGLGPAAEAQNTATPVTQCGTIISAPGIYGVKQSLQSTSDTVDCIQISASGVALTIPIGSSLRGPGGAGVTAAGIRILESVQGVELFLQGATIQGFGVGILNEGSGVSMLGGYPQGFTVTGNAAQGVLISNANSVVINELISEENGAAGLELSHASGVIVQGNSLLQSNGGYGLSVHSSSGNQFFDVDVFDNKLDGIHVGEPSTGAGVNRLTGFEAFGNAGAGGVSANPIRFRPFSNTSASQHNIFVGGGVVQNGGAGIAIGRGDSLNVVTGMGGQSNWLADAVDENGNCSLNTWTKNEFSTQAPSCIQ